MNLRRSGGPSSRRRRRWRSVGPCGVGIMGISRPSFLAPTDAFEGLEVAADGDPAILEVVHAFFAVALADSLSQDLGPLDRYPLLPHHMLPHLQEGHWILVWV